MALDRSRSDSRRLKRVYPGTLILVEDQAFYVLKVVGNLMHVFSRTAGKRIFSNKTAFTVIEEAPAP